MHRPDVACLRDSMTPEQMDGWIAYYTVEPFGDEWAQAGTIAATVQNMITGIAAAMGGHKVSEKDLVAPSYFIPGAEQEKPRGRMTTAREQEAFFKSMIRP